MTFQYETTVKFRHYAYGDNSPTTLKMPADIFTLLSYSQSDKVQELPTYVKVEEDNNKNDR